MVLNCEGVIILVFVVWGEGYLFVCEEWVKGMNIIVEFGWLFWVCVVFYYVFLKLIIFVDLKVRIICFGVFVNDNVWFVLVLMLLVDRFLLCVFYGFFNNV